MYERGWWETADSCDWHVGVDVRKEVKEDVKRLYSAEKDYDCRGGVVGSNIVPRRAMNLGIKKGKRATR